MLAIRTSAIAQATNKKESLAFAPTAVNNLGTTTTRASITKADVRTRIDIIN